MKGSQLDVRKFEPQDFKVIYQWYKMDINIQKYLGPIDEEWQEYILNDNIGDQLVFLKYNQIVGCAGVVFPSTENQYFTLSDIVVYPNYQKAKIGTSILEKLLSLYDKTVPWKSHVDIRNTIAIQFFLKNGWSEKNRDHEMITFIYQ